MAAKGPIKDSPFKDAIVPKSGLGGDHSEIHLLDTDLGGLPLVIGVGVGAGEGSDLFGWIDNLGG